MVISHCEDFVLQALSGYPQYELCPGPVHRLMNCSKMQAGWSCSSPPSLYKDQILPNLTACFHILVKQYPRPAEERQPQTEGGEPLIDQSHIQTIR